jgi:GNAT superfamily N-acetyltransferase
MLAAAAREYPSQRAPFPADDNAAAATLHGMIDHGVVIVAEMAGDVVGVIGGAVSRHPFDVSLRVLAHHFVVVAEPHRGAGIGSFLLDAFNAEAEVQRVDWVTVSIHRDTPVGIDTALCALGYSLADRTYLREVGR